MTLKEILNDWTDFDIAMYHLACCLGLMEFENFRQAKGVLNYNNEISTALYEMLEMLVKLNILERNDDGYRWNKLYKGGWEI